MAATRYKLGDNSPLLFKTEDYGKQWKVINGKQREDDFTRCIREDTVKPGKVNIRKRENSYINMKNEKRKSLVRMRSD